MAGLGLSVTDGVIDAVIDRGDANLFDGAMCAALTDCLLEPPAGAHVLRLRAVGPNFCLGRDRAATTPDDLRVEVQRLIALNRALGVTRLATVAEVGGDAAGFGVGLAALCHLTIAAPSAGFRFPEVDIDLVPTVVLTWLPRLVGRKQAFALTATGERIDAHRAMALGLITDVAPSDDALSGTVDEAIRQLRKHQPRVHAEISAFLRATADLTEDQANDLALEKLILASMARTSAPDLDLGSTIKERSG